MYSHMSRSQHPQKSTSRSSSPETSQGPPQMEGGKFPYSNSRFVSGLRSEGKEQESLEDNYDTDGWHNEYNEDFECALDEEGEGGDYGEGMEALGDSIKHLLHVRRVTTMTLDEDSVTIAVPMDIRCLLVEGSTLVIIAMEEVDESKEREGGAGNKKRQGKGSSSWGVHAGVQAEAEIGLQELLELREGAGSVVSTDVVNVMLQGDYSYLKTLAAELMNTIEIRIEGGEARLVLSLEKKKSFTASRRPSIAI